MTFLDINPKRLGIFYPKSFSDDLFLNIIPKMSNFQAEFLTFLSHLEAFSFETGHFWPV